MHHIPICCSNGQADIAPFTDEALLEEDPAIPGPARHAQGVGDHSAARKVKQVPLCRGDTALSV